MAHTGDDAGATTKRRREAGPEEAREPSQRLIRVGQAGAPKASRGGAGVSVSSAARRQKSVRVRTEKVLLRGVARAAIGQPAGMGEAQLGGCVLYGPSAAREAAPAACAGSLRLRTPRSVVRCLSGRHPGSGHGFGKEAHETVSWEKAARRTVAPSPSVLRLTLFPQHDAPSRKQHVSSSRHSTGFFMGCPSGDQSAAIKQAFVGQELARRTKAAGDCRRILCCPTKNSTDTTKNSTKTTIIMPVYRCGICNVFSSSLEQHARHLNGARHKRNEASALAGTVRAASDGAGKGAKRALGATSRRCCVPRDAGRRRTGRRSPAAARLAAPLGTRSVLLGFPGALRRRHAALRGRVPARDGGRGLRHHRPEPGRGQRGGGPRRAARRSTAARGDPAPPA